MTEEGLKGLCPHVGRHFLGRVKPWALERGWGAGSKGGPEKPLGRYQNLGRVAGYLRSVNYQPLVNRSKCAARFAEMWPSSRCSPRRLRRPRSAVRSRSLEGTFSR